jgi:hypothetical protein
MFVSIMAGLVVAIIISQPQSGSPWGRDDTDPPGSKPGLVIYTDARTGLQYLGTPSGGLTPRLDRDGSHISVNPQGN